MLEVRNLTVSFTDELGKGREESVDRAVRGISFSMNQGEILAIIGESGSGKSMTALSIAGLLPKTAGTSGEIFFSSVDVSRWRFFTCLCTIQLVFLASQSVVDQQPICWAGQPTETSTRFFIKPQKQRSTMFVLRPKTLRQGLSGGGGKTEQKD